MFKLRQEGMLTYCVDWPPSYVHYYLIIPSSITSINIFLYELPLFIGSEHRTRHQTQPSEDFKQNKMCMFTDKNKSLTTGASLTCCVM